MDKRFIKQQREIARRTLKSFRMNENENHENGEDPGFNPATFLYIRSYDGDVGARPVPSGVICWQSPDIEIYKDGILVDTANPLEPGLNYTIRVTVRNDGDMDCNSCMVDVFITHPSVGFTVNGNLRLGLGCAAVAAHSFSDVDFSFTAIEEMCGHKCLFARAYNLTTNDYPTDWDHFYSREDRHIAQQNINIVREGETIGFNVVVGRGTSTKGFDITLTKHTKSFSKDQSLLKRFAINTRRAVPLEAFEVKKLEKLPVETGINIKGGRGPIAAKKTNKIEQALVPKEIQRIKKNLWRDSLQQGTTQMNLRVPIFGLKDNEAVPLELSVKDPETGRIIGGITLLVVK